MKDNHAAAIGHFAIDAMAVCDAHNYLVHKTECISSLVGKVLSELIILPYSMTVSFLR